MYSTVNPLGVSGVLLERAAQRTDIGLRRGHRQIAGDASVAVIRRPGFDFRERQGVAQAIQAISEFATATGGEHALADFLIVGVINKPCSCVVRIAERIVLGAIVSAALQHR